MSAQIAANLIDWQTGFTNAWTQIANFVPKLAIFLVVLVIGILVSKAVSGALGKVMERLGFNTVLEKSGANRMLEGTQIKPIGLITKLVYYFLLLIFLQLALSAFGPTNPVSAIVNDIVAWLPSLFVAVVILVVVGAIANAVRDLMGAALAAVSYGALLTRITTVFIMALGVIAALNQIGVGATVTLPVLIAVLATIGGILVVGVGGGLVRPMTARWEGWLQTISSEASKAQAPQSPAGGAPMGQTPYGEAPPSPQPPQY
ncbi:mechanosensitive ion channel family protein [Nocardioides limicola]|uniref:mechanosensitive ion channel family protein n=1 Tax=Nocardioides limicola TaxID=2803368 RepID=UPI00193B2F9D|nr:hypothetical protein [Nocardioides sp. DJM-14]